MPALSLLAAACLTPQAAHAVDGTWTGPGSDWTTGTNWSSSPTAPDNIATFTNNGAPTAVSIASTTINTIQFDAAAPAYAFTNGGVFSIEGAGVVDNSAFAPSLTNNFFVFFANASSAGNLALTNNGFITFADTSSAGSATIINSGGGTLISFADSSSAFNATVTTNGGALTQFTGNATAGNAKLVTAAGGLVDFSGTSGPTGNNQVSAGSIEGAGDYFLGANQLTVGSNNLSTTVSGTINDGGTFGGTGARWSRSAAAR